MQSGREIAVGVQPGHVLAGKYRVERVLGAGGMGVVVAAHHLQLDERVALKFLLPEALANPEAVARFVREARAAAKIKSEHVARVSDVGQLENGAPYMVMEYLQGADLSTILAQQGPLPVGQAIDFVLQAGEAIAEAHSLGIVHRDLKPSNLFCIRRPDGQLAIKVLDFGISKLTSSGPNEVAMTRTAALVGSPLYMSPEQMTSSKDVDARTDVWSLGVILHELLTGRPPFAGEAVTELAVKVCTQPAPALRTIRADAPEGVERVVLKCLEKDRQQRLASLAEVAIALADFAPVASRISIDRILGLAAASAHPSLGAGGAVLGSPGRATQSSWGQTGVDEHPPMSRWPRRLVAGTLALGAVLVGVAGYVTLAHRPPASPSSEQAVSAPAATPLPAFREAPPAASYAESNPPSAATLAPLPTTGASSGPTSVAASTSSNMTPPRARPVSVPVPRASAAPSSLAAPPSCNPPYTFDPSGNKVFKKECL